MRNRKNVWLITGPPAVGKSTLISKVVFNLRSRGAIVGGCVTSEKRVDGQRVGFRVKDLLTGVEGELASISGRLGPRIGKYRVNLKDLSLLGANSLLTASKNAELVVIDEVGPMELTSPDFRRALRTCLESEKPLLAVVHERLNDPLIEEIKAMADDNLFTVGLENRDSLVKDVTSLVGRELSGESR